jgi:hypothetical protein
MENSININNTIMKKMSTTKIQQMNILKPDIQRIIDNIKVQDIVNMQLIYFKKYLCFNFNASGPLNIHVLEGKYYLLDGQHRLAALDYLYKNHSHNIEVYIILVNVDSCEELEFNYNMINNNTPLPDFSSFHNINKQIPETVAVNFQQMYPKMWSASTRSRRPHIFFNHFQESLAYICEKVNITDVHILQDLITNYNDKISKWDANIVKKNFNVNDKMFNVAVEQGFYMGLISHQSCEEYGYQWAKKIVEDITGETIKSTSSYAKKKKNIPKKVKNDAWDQYVGKTVAISKCLCCKKTEINAKDFVAGHIISEFNGGQVTIDNLVPICQQCNTSMSVTNMEEYISKHYPENLETFKIRNYNKPGNQIWAYFTNSN